LKPAERHEPAVVVDARVRLEQVAVGQRVQEVVRERQPVGAA
jgi:hypothetical protein